MKTDNIQALKDALAGFSKAETEFDNYIFESVVENKI